MRIEKIKKSFYSKQVFLFDLDGTLYLGKRPIKGARQLIERLRGQNKRVFFFTNNSSKSKGEYFTKLRGMGLAKSRDEIILSTEVMARYLKERAYRRIFVLGTPAMKKTLKDWKISHDTRSPEAVVVGYDRTLTFEKLKQAAFLISKGLPFLVTHPDYFCPTEWGPEPDCGAFAYALQLTTKRKPELVLGKPHRRMIEEVFRRMKVSRSQLVLVGDRLSTDIAMAKNAGIQSVLVLSGDSQKSDIRSSRVKPSFIIRSVADLL